MADFMAKVRAQLDTSEAQSKLDAFCNQQKELKFKINLLDKSGLNVNSIAPQIQRQFAGVGQSIGANLARSIQTAMGNYYTNNSNNTIRNMQRSLMDFKVDTGTINALTKNLEHMDLGIKNVTTNIRKNGNIQLAVTGTDALGRTVTQIKEFDRESQKMVEVSKTINQTFKQMFTDVDASKLNADLSTLESSFTKIGSGAQSQITQIQSLKTALSEIWKIRGDNAQQAEFDRISASAEKLGIQLRELRAQTSIKESFFNQGDVSKLNASLTQLEANFAKLKGAGNTYSSEIAGLKTSLSKITEVGDLKAQQAEFDKISKRAKELGTSYKQLKAEIQKVTQAQQLMSNKTILDNKITTWMNNNIRAAKAYNTELTELQKRLQTVSTSADLKSVSTQFNILKSSASAEGLTGKTLLQQFTSNITKLSPLFGMGALITTTVSGLKNMYNTVVELDTALIDLQKTTTASFGELQQFYFEANDIAKQYGATTQEIIQSAADWSRLGYSLDDSKLMSQYSSMFKSISPGMDIEKSTTGLVSVMKANIYALLYSNMQLEHI